MYQYTFRTREVLAGRGPEVMGNAQHRTIYEKSISISKLHNSGRLRLMIDPNMRVRKANNSKIQQKTEDRFNAMTFEHQMRDYSIDLMNEFEQNLDDAERKHIDSLQELSDQLDEKCQLLDSTDVTLRSKLGDEILEIEDPGEPQLFEQNSINDLIDTYRNFVNDNVNTLNDLWLEWSGVQQELLCLAVEIFGKEILVTENVEVSLSFREQISKSVAEHETVNKQYSAATQQLSEAEQTIKELSFQAKKTLNAQLRKIKLGQQKKRAVYDALWGITATSDAVIL